MPDRDDLLNAWQATGTDLVMLPSYAEVRLDLPSVPALLASGQMPGYLRALAMKFMGEEGVDTDEFSDEDKEKWTKFENLLISNAVVALKPPGWDKEAPFRITLEDLEADPPRVPRYDRIALRDMCLRLRTPKMVDCLSRVAKMETDLREEIEGGLDDPEIIEQRKDMIDEKAKWAATVIAAEKSETVEGWSSFRRLGRGDLVSAQRTDVGDKAVQTRDHLRPGGRPPVRRRARAETEPAPEPKPARKRK